MKLGDRIALVTGGGSGIGRAIALTFAEEGARVVVNDVRAAAAKETLEAMGPRQAQGRAIQADVSDSGQVRAMFAELERELGTLDILVNNAGIAETTPGEREKLSAKSEARMKELASGQGILTHWDVTQEMTDEAWTRMLAVHLNGTFFCTREALKLMSRRNLGRVEMVRARHAGRSLGGSARTSRGGGSSCTAAPRPATAPDPPPWPRRGSGAPRGCRARRARCSGARSRPRSCAARRPGSWSPAAA